MGLLEEQEQLQNCSPSLTCRLGGWDEPHPDVHPTVGVPVISQLCTETCGSLLLSVTSIIIDFHHTEMCPFHTMKAEVTCGVPQGFRLTSSEIRTWG